MGSILVINAGSSSIKAALFDADLSERATASAEEIGGASRLTVGPARDVMPLPDHRAALTAILDAFARGGHPLASVSAAAHRVVHGGAALTAPCRITPDVLAAIDACVPLAPLHNPANLTAIRALADLAPHLPQYASFDTAFHATNPPVAIRYALPPGAEALGLRRYGFHGISYASLTQRLPGLTGAPLPRRLLALHLGNGASLCAIRDGQSVATTMGYSPLDGLTMGTRTGGIDGNAVLRLAQEHGIDGATRILNRESGLRGLGGHSDMRALRAAGTPEATFAIDHFAYWAVRHAGSMVAAMGGLDAIAFTAGIGENDADMRARIVAGLGWLGADLDPPANAANAPRLHSAPSRVAIWTVPAAEERQIALEAQRLIAGGPA
jgi:acetate kinase